MKNDIFRPVEFWKESLTTLPENAFFELLRTVFGKIKTPFNKQILTADLEKFLSRNDIQKNIACYIDQDDARIICAVAALNEPSPQDMEAFFSGDQPDDIDPVELHDRIVNLEERFILYRFFEKEQSRLALNPVLSPVLLPYTKDRHTLFPSFALTELPDGETGPDSIVFDDRILTALFSFVSQADIYYRPEGGMRQKTINAAKNVFPGLPFETFMGGLRILGLFSADSGAGGGAGSGGKITGDYHKFTAFGGLSRQERLAYCAASLVCFGNAASLTEDKPSSTEYSPWLFRVTVRDYAALINSICNSLDPDRLYPPTALHRLIYLLKHNNNEISNERPITERPVTEKPTNEKPINERLIEAMEQTGLLVLLSDKYRRKPQLADAPLPGSTVIAMDSSLTVLVYPEIAYNDALDLAAFTAVVEAGQTVRLQLSRDSAVSAYDRGVSASSIIELLQRLSNNRIDENLVFSLRDWEKRHREVTLRRGLVLTLSPEHQYLAETKPLAALILETLAPGIYMLHESAAEKAPEVLRKAGVAIIARREESAQAGENEYRGSGTRFYAGEYSFTANKSFYAPLHASHAEKLSPVSVNNAASASTLIEGFRAMLDKERHGKEEHDELAARIDRRLILCESQLREAVVRYEKLEAGGLDYAGKAMIAKQAIAMRAAVEIVWPSRQKQERVFGIPKALEKTESGNCLIVSPLDNPDDTVRVPLGKISFLRRIKKSIFEKN